MADSLRALEERLEQLVPKGLSDFGLERMEDEIDRLAGALAMEEGASSGPTVRKWGIGAAAALGVLAVVYWSPEGGSERGVDHLPGESDLVAAVVSIGDGGRAPQPSVSVWQDVLAAEEFLVLSSARRVQGRQDRGWTPHQDGGAPHRYWSYEVIDEEELVDTRSGYAVRVVSQHEEWVPVEMTSL